MGKVKVIAHRGASADAPENTLAAVALAVDHGADFVEIDVRRTLDGELVVIHDPTLQRTTDVLRVFPGRARYDVAGFTLPEIRDLDAGSWFGPGFAGVRVPTLYEVLTALAGRAGLLLEVKDPASAPGIADDLHSVLDAAGWLEEASAGQLVVQSADWTFVNEFHLLLPEVPVGLLGGPPLPQEIDGAAGWAHCINPKNTKVTADLVRRVHGGGMVLWPYTVDNPRRMRELIQLGADGIITNRPALLAEVLAADPVLSRLRRLRRFLAGLVRTGP
ncbi:glycerophosphodiester phosphodiesterase [Arthrobacter sp. MSA 4-2]|uniref:glycerophosphodiester phosphodiesterase n=1 Tax=Arthrobacter sp. MSA 4-2 TaxID=2794349 RepID=UPI0018E87FCA|nr:glycerophosphodiester phosphodiesterase family protein [Arthrobacter sp. MSA 4-2]MBJ2121915.1 glycerophosphodiester phosphodiesterase [Arthrobacter sp. MSA 4-2]